MNKEDIKLRKLVLRDLRTYITYNLNNNYKERLLEKYYLFKENDIQSEQDIIDKQLNIGGFSYDEIIIFDRLEDETYRAILASSLIEITSIKNLPDDFGDQLSTPGKKR